MFYEGNSTIFYLNYVFLDGFEFVGGGFVSNFLFDIFFVVLDAIPNFSIFHQCLLPSLLHDLLCPVPQFINIHIFGFDPHRYKINVFVLSPLSYPLPLLPLKLLLEVWGEGHVVLLGLAIDG
jgi:hypothetical protein